MLRILKILNDNSLVLLSVGALLTVIGIVTYTIRRRRNKTRPTQQADNKQHVPNQEELQRAKDIFRNIE